MKIEVGQKWRSMPSKRAWKVIAISDLFGKPCVELSQGNMIKKVQIQYLKSGYMLVGSKKEQDVIKDWKQRNWQLADDVE